MKMEQLMCFIIVLFLKVSFSPGLESVDFYYMVAYLGNSPESSRISIVL